jgi:glycosyltransferase involved in cell wall biosynthesis
MDKNEPSVCVVMPVYNGAKTIELAIKSLLYQTYTNWNCVIVNDGSTDSTKKILDKITDNRFIIIHLEKNIGRGGARQIALQNAMGDYLAFLDADDFYHSEKIDTQVKAFKYNNDVELVSCGQGSYDEKFELLSVRGTLNQGKHFYKIGMQQKFTCASSMIKIKSATKLNYNTQLNASEDIDFLSRYLDNKQYFVIDSLLYYYSEFESFSYFKTLEYNYYKLIRIALMFKKEKLKSIEQFSKTIFKTIVYLIFIPLLGKKFFIKKRGQIPNSKQINEYNKQLSKLMDNNQ